jgi:sugar transferase (PEP-CTERM system associated)
MIRLLHAHFPSRTVFLGLSEAFLVSFAFLVATVMRLGTDEASIMLSYEQGIVKIAVVLIASLVCMYYFDLYNSSILTNRREAIARLIQVLGTECILLALVYYVYPPLELGRGIFLIGFALMAVLLFLWRRLFARLNVLPQFAQRTLIFGDGPLAQPLLYEFGSRPELGVNVVSHLAATAEVDSQSCDYETSTSTSLDDLAQSVKSFRVNRVVVAMGERRGKMPVGTLLSLKSSGVLVQDGTDVYEAITGKIPVESLRLGWLLFSPGFHVSRFFLLYKRVAALIASTIGLLLSFPLLPFVVLLIKLTSPGPVLYRQKRVGRNGVVFDCYKFRTMRADAEADSGPTWAGDEDPRITPVGRFLRKSRMDEIPQFWNVLKGDMDFVGPRPERPEFVDWLNREIPHYNLRHTVRPGITGWAQIRYQYGSSVEDAKEKLRYDLFYVKNMSPGLDLLIFLETIKIILLGRGAK